ncbi:MAG TPA: UDP-3-O-(3-hydroxymyristoyl)glucosamine N-acyltransferase [Verrucomicrobiae bacterium]|jgi:UDP-3-O-[3-hydroxymyristoyl] glucosamine N-acyltransferase
MFTTAEIAKELNGEVIGDESLALTGFAPATTAKSGDLTFAENETFFQKAEQTAASAILIDGQFTSASKTLIRVASARIAFARVLPLFFPDRVFVPGVHPTAVVDATAQVDPAAHIGPHCVVGEKAKIGPGVVLQGGNHIGRNAVIGAQTRLFPNVVIYGQTQIGQRVRIHAGAVIGSDGFGYVFDSKQHLKVQQVGHVVVQDDVEIGANVTIDRGALGATTIGKGTKIDNLVQIAHNVSVGEHCLVVAQVGVAGSTKIGHYTTLAGQVGITGHLKIGNKVTIAAQSGVMHDVPDNGKWLGSPAQPDRQAKRQMIALHQLPELIRRVTELEKLLQPPPPKKPGD